MLTSQTALGEPLNQAPDTGLETCQPVKVVLGSASPARLKTLQNAGVFPEVIISDVDERAAVRAAETERGPLYPADHALLLAKAKAEAVAAEWLNRHPNLVSRPAEYSAIDGEPYEQIIVIGCDSVFEFEGKPYGRPPNPETAIARIQQMRNNSGTLHTGHWVILLPEGTAVGRIGNSIVHFGDMDDAEITAYVATGEPLNVAGSFTVDGLGGPFIESIEGDYHNVVGISLPLLRNLLGQLGIPWRAIRSAK